MSVFIVTLEDPQVYEIVRCGPLVQSARFGGINFIRDFFAGLRDFWGGRARGYERAIRDARAGAIADLQVEAEKRGFNAVLGVRIDTSLSRGSVLATAEGTVAEVDFSSCARGRALAAAHRGPAQIGN